MIKIKIKSNYITTIPYNVEIYDTCNNLVFEGQTINNEIIFDNCNCGPYKLVVINKCIPPYTMRLYFIPTCNVYVYFNVPSSLTFRLTDAAYPGLPIERGELILNG